MSQPRDAKFGEFATPAPSPSREGWQKALDVLQKVNAEYLQQRSWKDDALGSAASCQVTLAVEAAIEALCALRPAAGGEK